jgi:hypothetical protein
VVKKVKGDKPLPQEVTGDAIERVFHPEDFRVKEMTETEPLHPGQFPPGLRRVDPPSQPTLSNMSSSTTIGYTTTGNSYNYYQSVYDQYRNKISKYI